MRLRLRVVPAARRDAVLGVHGEALRVSVRAVPEKGRANEAVERAVAEALGVAAADVAVVAGHGSRDKVLLVRGVDPTDLRARVAAALGA